MFFPFAFLSAPRARVTIVFTRDVKLTQQVDSPDYHVTRDTIDDRRNF